MNTVFAFALNLPVPAGSPSGWTRGMPPPRSPAHPTFHTPVRRRVPSTTTVRAAISEPRPDTQRAADTTSPYSDDSTVAAYLSAETALSVRTPPQVDQLVDALAEADDAPGPSRIRRDVIDSANGQTKSVHAGERVRGDRKTKATLDAITAPIVQSATYTFASTRDCIAYNMGHYESYEYGRYGNPTARTAEEKIAALEGADDCLLSASGMSSVTTMLLALVPEGGHVVTTTDCYRRTRQFMETMLPKMRIGCTVLDPADVDGLREVLTTRGATLYFSESPTNPLIRVVDIPTIAQLCREHNCVSVLDTTFATSFNCRPLSFGADLVLHSATKYLSGHQDVMAGALAGRGDLIAKVRSLHEVLGGVVDPHAAYLVIRGMKTLGVRMAAHNRNAEAVARLLVGHDKVKRVHYPTLESHPDHKIASALYPDGFGGVLSFELVGDGDSWSAATFAAVGRFVDNLKIAYIGPSLGGCETLVEQVCVLGYFDKPLSMRKELGITNGLIRFACGIEDTDDLLNDIEEALRHV